MHQLTTRVARVDAEAARYVHWGATSQDIIDTALVLQLRASVPAIVERSRSARPKQPRKHARQHAATPMAGRTWLQQATPMTFGLKAAGWLDALDRVSSARFAPPATARWCCSSAARPARWRRSARTGRRWRQRLAARLKLAVPALPWHAHRDRLASLACALGVATGTSARSPATLALLAQTEVGEAHERPAAGGGSSTMPHKRNPVRAAVAVAAAVRAPGLVATMLERDAAGARTRPRRLAGGVGHAARARVGRAARPRGRSPKRSRGWSSTRRACGRTSTSTGGLVLAEAVVMQLAPTLGRPEAHALVERAARRAAEERRAFAEVLAEDPAVTAILDRPRIKDSLLPENYLGSAAAFVANVLARHGKV